MGCTVFNEISDWHIGSKINSLTLLSHQIFTYLKGELL